MDVRYRVSGLCHRGVGSDAGPLPRLTPRPAGSSVAFKTSRFKPGALQALNTPYAVGPRRQDRLPPNLVAVAKAQASSGLSSHHLRRLRCNKPFILDGRSLPGPVTHYQLPNEYETRGVGQSYSGDDSIRLNLKLSFLRPHLGRNKNIYICLQVLTLPVNIIHHPTMHLRSNLESPHSFPVRVLQGFGT